MKIIYLHGFNSSFESNTVSLLKMKFDIQGLSYNFSNPLIAYEQIDSLIKKYLEIDKDVLVIGTSLGGFWANYFAKKYNLRSLLVNPCLTPLINIKKYIGERINFSTGEKTFITEESILEYKMLPIVLTEQEKNYNTTILGIEDKIIPYLENISIPGTIILVEKMGHRIGEENIEIIYQTIEEISKNYIL